MKVYQKPSAVTSKDKQWEALKRYGRAKAHDLGLTERDVPKIDCRVPPRAKSVSGRDYR
jgi:hypothetical protein